jgi:hypothetical protein
MSTDPKRSHGAQPDESQKDPKILMAVRTTNKRDEKTGRAIPGDRKVFIPGQEKQLDKILTEDQKNALETGGFVQGMGVNLPSERSLRKDPTIRANAEDESTNVVGNPKRQLRTATAPAGDSVDPDDEEGGDNVRTKAKRSRKGKR